MDGGLTCNWGKGVGGGERCGEGGEGEQGLGGELRRGAGNRFVFCDTCRSLEIPEARTS